MSPASEVAGVLPVVQTPYADDGSIDVTALDAELAWVLDQGADGLTTGMVSEILSLSESERRLLTERVAAVAGERGRCSVVSC
ncbi:MAG: dihydrodipicolinate synthase family protein, partial [Microthrixaceae bacterium]|nr:dihydrodipicolinate synthase family protein [Microthrixaceae bacterium]